MRSFVAIRLFSVEHGKSTTLGCCEMGLTKECYGLLHESGDMAKVFHGLPLPAPNRSGE